MKYLALLFVFLPSCTLLRFIEENRDQIRSIGTKIDGISGNISGVVDDVKAVTGEVTKITTGAIDAVKEDYASIVAKADKDGDGRMSWSELIGWLSGGTVLGGGGIGATLVARRNTKSTEKKQQERERAMEKEAEMNLNHQLLAAEVKRIQERNLIPGTVISNISQAQPT